ncbi:MAG: hypothetical protein HC831_19830 [Chloroflexia bacterium]|nr:hypothetical protein [Chloroflexia bacterium]
MHEPLTTFPTTKLSPVGGYNNNSIAYAADNPGKVVRIAIEGDVVYYSGDKGATWTAASNNMGVSGRVAINADGGTICIALGSPQRPIIQPTTEEAGRAVPAYRLKTLLRWLTR